MKANSKSLPSLAFASAILICMSGAFGATPLYQWNFNTNGSNTGTGTGGTLTANVGAGATTGSFGAPGVSGAAGDYSLGTNNAYDHWWGTDVGDAAGAGTLDLSTVNQFTITLWVKRSGGNASSLLNIGSSSTPGTSSNPGISLGVQGNWSNGVDLRVNGYSAGSGDLWGAGYTSNWVFLAVAYDGTAGNIWWNPVMNGLYGTNNNAAIITGDMGTGASFAQGMAMHIGDWGTSPGIPAVGATATAFLANDGLSATGFSGNLDDVRIYNSLLSVSEIEAVRLSAIPEPSSAAALGAMGVMALLRRRRL